MAWAWLYFVVSALVPCSVCPLLSKLLFREDTAWLLSPMNDTCQGVQRLRPPLLLACSWGSDLCAEMPALLLLLLLPSPNPSPAMQLPPAPRLPPPPSPGYLRFFSATVQYAAWFLRQLPQDGEIDKYKRGGREARTALLSIPPPAFPLNPLYTQLLGTFEYSPASLFTFK